MSECLIGADTHDSAAAVAVRAPGPTLAMRLALLFLADMLIVAATSLAMHELAAVSHPLNLARGSLLLGVVLATGVCGGLSIAWTARASGWGYVLAIGWTVLQGYVLLLVSWCLTSPARF